MYKTIQYKSLCDFFERGTKEQYTSDEIIEAVCPEGVGKSTVYRQLARMTETGELRKFHDGKRILYQYSHISPDCGSHFHLKCISCGRLIHLNCDRISEFASHMAADHGFTLDMRQTVLYGLCAQCSKKGVGKQQ